MRRYKLPALYRIDCVGCQSASKRDRGFASGVICDFVDSKTKDRTYRLCNITQGDSTDWDTRTIELLDHASNVGGFSSGALRGV